MPRTSRKSDSRPFAAESSAPFASLPAAQRRAVAKAIAADKAGGLSGDEMRSKYGPRLTGPARRKVLREYGYVSTAHIARSYDAYRDGEDRKGTRHAREHGANAAQGKAPRKAASRKAASPSPARKAASRPAKAPAKAAPAKARKAPQRGRKAA
jgi:hypothetical protein